MGLGGSKKKFLTNEEIEKISANNNSLERFYHYHKGYDGSINKRDFETLFNRKLDVRITKKIFKIFASEKDKFFYEDLKYFYSILHTRNYNAKINFITELIFSHKSSKNINKYREGVELIFGKNLEIRNKLLTNEFLCRISEKSYKFKIIKELFSKNLDIFYSDFFLKLVFLKTYYESNKTKFEKGVKNNCICDCYFSSSYEKANNSNDMYEFIYDKMETEFRRMEKMNDGLFTIQILEKFLCEIGVNTKIINSMISYLKRKTQRNFIDFKSFKHFFISCLGNNEEKIKFLFEIFSYPKDYIDKKVILTLINSLQQSSIIIENIENELRNYFIKKDKVFQSDFLKCFTEFSFMYEFIISLDRINYIPYIYFKIRPDDKRMEKQCIENIMKGEKNLKKFIEKIVLDQSENEFFCINLEFWEIWCEHVEWTGKSKDKIINDLYEEKSKLNSISSSLNTMSSLKPRLQIDKISGELNGKLAPGLIYFQHYVILPSNIFNLFTRWYMTIGSEIKVKKIVYDYIVDSINCHLNITETMFIKNGKIYEIETYPVFMKYFTFEEIYKNISEIKLELVKELLTKLTLEIKLNISRTISFSKKTKYLEIKNFLEKCYNFGANSKTKLWIFHQDQFYNCDDLNKTLEEDRIKENCLIILESMKENQWLSESLLKENNENTNSMNKIIKLNPKEFKTPDSCLKGIVNIGNTCYMNSVLQILLNIKEMRDIFITKNFKFCINYKNKFGNKGKIIREFLRLIDEKWEVSKDVELKPLRPIAFKEVIGEANNQFKNHDQQDSQEFFNYFLDVLHEEINLKSEKEYIPNPENYDYTDEELANEYWANNMRRNSSLIHSIFLGQLKSTLICEKCETSKTSFETFTNLILPITQKKTVTIEVIFFRIPFIFKAYYLDNYNEELDSIDVNQFLSNVRKASLDSLDGDVTSDKAEESKSMHSNNKNKLNGISNSNLYASRLSTSIPLKIIFEIERKAKLEKIYELLKDILELELETTKDSTGLGFHLTTYAMAIGNDSTYTFIDPEIQIDECLQNNQIVYVYEFLNSFGINKFSKDKGKKHNDTYNNNYNYRRNSSIISNSLNLITPLNGFILSNINNPSVFEKYLNTENCKFFLITHYS